MNMNPFDSIHNWPTSDWSWDLIDHECNQIQVDLRWFRFRWPDHSSSNTDRFAVHQVQVQSWMKNVITFNWNPIDWHQADSDRSLTLITNSDSLHIRINHVWRTDRSLMLITSQTKISDSSGWARPISDWSWDLIDHECDQIQVDLRWFRFRRPDHSSSNTDRFAAQRTDIWWIINLIRLINLTQMYSLDKGPIFSRDPSFRHESDKKLWGFDSQETNDHESDWPALFTWNELWWIGFTGTDLWLTDSDWNSDLSRI